MWIQVSKDAGISLTFAWVALDCSDLKRALEGSSTATMDNDFEINFKILFTTFHEFFIFSSARHYFTFDKVVS